MCQYSILNTKGNTIVSYCTSCKNHYIWQNSFLLTFTLDQYEAFVLDLSVTKSKKEYVRFPDGVLRTFLDTPMREVLLTFTEKEWGDFGQAVEEAYYMREVYEIINKDIKS